MINPPRVFKHKDTSGPWKKPIHTCVRPFHRSSDGHMRVIRRENNLRPIPGSFPTIDDHAADSPDNARSG
jgi:hypothetical protein